MELVPGKGNPAEIAGYDGEKLFPLRLVDTALEQAFVAHEGVSLGIFNINRHSEAADLQHIQESIRDSLKNTSKRESVKIGYIISSDVIEGKEGRGNYTSPEIQEVIIQASQLTIITDVKIIDQGHGTMKVIVTGKIR